MTSFETKKEKALGTWIITREGVTKREIERRNSDKINRGKLRRIKLTINLGLSSEGRRIKVKKKAIEMS